MTQSKVLRHLAAALSYALVGGFCAGVLFNLFFNLYILITDGKKLFDFGSFLTSPVVLIASAIAAPGSLIGFLVVTPWETSEEWDEDDLFRRGLLSSSIAVSLGFAGCFFIGNFWGLLKIIWIPVVISALSGIFMNAFPYRFLVRWIKS